MAPRGLSAGRIGASLSGFSGPSVPGTAKGVRGGIPEPPENVTPRSCRAIDPEFQDGLLAKVWLRVRSKRRSPVGLSVSVQPPQWPDWRRFRARANDLLNQATAAAERKRSTRTVTAVRSVHGATHTREACPNWGPLRGRISALRSQVARESLSRLPSRCSAPRALRNPISLLRSSPRPGPWTLQPRRCAGRSS
jgi:hypothetical protein